MPPTSDTEITTERVKQQTTAALSKVQAIIEQGGKAKISDLQLAIQHLGDQISASRTKAQSLIQHARSQALKLSDYFEPDLAANDAKLKELIATLSTASKAPWANSAWESWEAIPTSELAFIRYGDMVEQRSKDRLLLPAYAPFIGKNNTIIIRSKGESVELGRALLQSLLVRTALMLPHQASYTLLDPAGNGMAFPMRRYLPQVRQSGDDVRRDLDQVTAEIRRIIETYLDASITSFEMVSEDLRINERFHFVFAADFPNKYDRRAIEALQSIGNTGPRAGVYLFIHLNEDYEMPRDLGMDGFKNTFYIGAGPNQFTTSGRITFGVRPDAPPPATLQDHVFAKLSAATPVERKLDWSEVVGLNEASWWSGDGSSLIETPIGKRGRGEPLRIWFGEERDGRPCVHGILGAATGAGKSTLFHDLIAGLTTRYSPEELRLYLIDGKYGVEFRPYTHLPHAEVVSLNTSADLSRSVLAELADEMKRRNDMFVRNGVAGLVGYRAKGQPSGKLPRILLIVDEYQQLFEDDQNGTASALLRQLSMQGRSAGIHMLLASQRFGAPGMLHQTAIFANIHLRIAMQMAEAEIRALTEFGPKGKQLILATCNLPGKLVVNDKGGDDSANVAGKAAFLSENHRDEILQALERKAETLPEDALPQRVVFNGRAQPDLVDNPHIAALLQHSFWMSKEDFEAYARKPMADGGLEISDWFIAEQPHVMWLGQQFNVRGQAGLVIRRRASEHALIIGGTNTVRYGMLAGVLTSLAATSDPTNATFAIVDRSIPGSQWSTTLQSVCDAVLHPAGFSVEFTREERDIQGMLQKLLGEMERRRMLDEVERNAQPTLFVVMTELDRVDALRRKAEAFGASDSPTGEMLRRLYSEGAPFGIHVILSFSGVRPMASVIDERRGLVHFRHRAALQMSEDESYVLARSRKAAQLQPPDAPEPIVALYVDMENEQRSVRFKPYSTAVGRDPLNGSLEEQLQRIGAVLQERRAPDEHGRAV